ncbi:hypothetical protein [Mesobacillus sp.]
MDYAKENGKGIYTASDASEEINEQSKEQPKKNRMKIQSKSNREK